MLEHLKLGHMDCSLANLNFGLFVKIKDHWSDMDTLNMFKEYM